MLRRRAAWLTMATGAAVACSSFAGADPTDPGAAANFGVVTARVDFSGYRLRRDGSDSVFAVLDSAIQGYGERQLFSGDTVHFYPVVTGQHELTLQVPLPFCAVENGPTRLFRIETGDVISVQYRVNCNEPAPGGTAARAWSVPVSQPRIRTTQQRVHQPH